MEQHPIGDLMEKTMQKIREMIDVNTIVGNPINTLDGTTLIPVSRVTFGFGAGGGDYAVKDSKPGADNGFGGGSGAGVNISPIAFLVVKDGSVKLLNVAPPANTTVDRVVELVPEIIDKIKEFTEKDKFED
ncbi:GerW family sporulation protein [Papillibacter cinnamivorans]|uniref:Sporulation protein YtfJ n=1 Tax=Papillibacter cinnamivorans DSM 12816 TaxID=1122930 RepID=A0A1W1YUP9_9FIRM|nr:GerW family sporulation protein [Papillibacter cinnamivorans]SMC39899.1 sporulation protein YtfJ [Papillibacter cinnamivorans DSM 12816]